MVSVKAASGKKGRKGESYYNMKNILTIKARLPQSNEFMSSKVSNRS